MWFGDPEFDRAFWPGFFGNLLADLIVAVGVVWLLTLLGQIFKRAKGDVLVDIIGAAPSGAGEKVDLIISLKNTGKIMFQPREVYWHVFVHPSVEVLQGTVRATPDLGTALLARKHAQFYDEPARYEHIEGITNIAIVPGIRYEVAGFSVQANHTRGFHVRCFMGTPYSQFPRRPLLGRIYLTLRHKLLKEQKPSAYHKEISFTPRSLP